MWRKQPVYPALSQNMQIQLCQPVLLRFRQTDLLLWTNRNRQKEYRSFSVLRSSRGLPSFRPDTSAVRKTLRLPLSAHHTHRLDLLCWLQNRLLRGQIYTEDSFRAYPECRLCLHSLRLKADQQTFFPWMPESKDFLCRRMLVSGSKEF